MTWPSYLRYFIFFSANTMTETPLFPFFIQDETEFQQNRVACPRSSHL